VAFSESYSSRSVTTQFAYWIPVVKMRANVFFNLSAKVTSPLGPITVSPVLSVRTGHVEFIQPYG
jgi:hypothetical protein